MKILLATDGSTFSEFAEKNVTATMRPQDAEVLVLQVVEPLMFAAAPQLAPDYLPEQAAKREEVLNLAKKTTDLTAGRLRTAGFKAESRVVENDSRNGILDTAAKWKPDLIVLGSHGRRGMAKFLLGSVAEAVARHARCSVLIVRTPDKAAAESRAA
ncbi:MAG TPA: universal stress protein [Candidatus Angelobacter sp.]|nr:universal stress protein [Candidatus Angelobacter sp.]